jgi:hypothetical protein
MQPSPGLRVIGLLNMVCTGIFLKPGGGMTPPTWQLHCSFMHVTRKGFSGEIMADHGPNPVSTPYYEDISPTDMFK